MHSSNMSMELLGRSVMLAAVLVFISADIGFSQAAEERSKGWTPIQLKLWGDCALFGNDRSVYGLRLGVVDQWTWDLLGDAEYASDIVGLDISLLRACPHRMRGILVSGLNAMSQDMTGIALGGLSAGGDSDWHPGRKDMTGIAVGGLYAGGKHMRGIAVGGLFAGGGDVKGIVVGGLWANANREMKGIAVGGIAASTIGSVGCTSTRGDATGILFGGLFTSARIMTGVQIGLINNCVELHGVQLGLFNSVDGRLGIPIINARF